MKKVSQMLAVIMVIILSLFSFSATAFAAQSQKQQDGLVASIISEKENYNSDEEISLIFKVTNTNDYDVKNVSLEAILPDGLKLKSSVNTRIDSVSLKAGESLELNLIAVSEKINVPTDVTESPTTIETMPTTKPTEPITDGTHEPTGTTPTESLTNATNNTTTDATQDTTKKESNSSTQSILPSGTSNSTNSNINTVGKNTVSTGDPVSYWIAGLICLFCLIVGILAFRFKKKTMKYLSLLLCACIAVGSVAVLGIPKASAEETTDFKQKEFLCNQRIFIDEESYVVNLKVIYSCSLITPDEANTMLDILNNDTLNSLKEKVKNSQSEKDKKAAQESIIEYFYNLEKSSFISNVKVDWQHNTINYKFMGIKCMFILDEKETNTFSSGYSNSNTKELNLNTINSFLSKIATYSEKESNKTRKNLILSSFDNNSQNLKYINAYQNITNILTSNSKCETSIIFNATVNDYKTKLSDYNAIFINSHGNVSDNESIINLEEKTNILNVIGYSYDLSHNLIGVYGGVGFIDAKYFITPQLITFYYEISLPDSFVYCCTCYGFENDSLKNAFLSSGASVFCGYDNSVSIPYDSNIVQKLVALLLKGDSVQSAYNTCIKDFGESDPSLPHARFKIAGNTRQPLFNNSAYFMSHCYYIYNCNINIEEARRYCESLGGHLATITSKEENEFLYNYMKKQGYESAYFGLEKTGNSWQWITGEEFNYLNWAEGEPNNANYSEKYGMFYYQYDNGKWNDGGPDTLNASSNNTPFICEWDS